MARACWQLEHEFRHTWLRRFVVHPQAHFGALKQLDAPSLCRQIPLRYPVVYPEARLGSAQAVSAEGPSCRHSATAMHHLSTLF